jgi:solute carrier family 25 (mitochondrial S-adenosylmethionine transporter), member 26
MHVVHARRVRLDHRSPRRRRARGIGGPSPLACPVSKMGLHPAAWRRPSRRKPPLIFLAPPPSPLPIWPKAAGPLAAAAAESLVALALAPVDAWKSRAQLANPVLSQTPPITSAAAALLPPGLRFRPFAGVAPAIALAAGETLTFVAVYRAVRADLERRWEGAPVRAAVAAGAVASVIAAAVSTPVDLVVQRLRAGRGRSVKAVLQAVRGGPRAWYVGMGPTIARDVPFDALEFAVFEGLQRGVLRARARAGWQQQQSTDGELRFLDNLVLGCVTGAIVGGIVAPLDLVVSRVLVEPARYRGVIGCIRKIVAEDGVQGLLAGTPQKIVRETFASGIFFSCYEAGTTILNKHVGSSNTSKGK